jgi:2-polyprenyl-3-methyl-5-hydroxy-6-metoxy-1,4-benzoquinol methylase
MDPSYVAVYRDLYERHWWWRAREQAVLSVIRQVHAPAPGDRVLDIGCGDGWLFDKLLPLGEVEGVEADPAAVTPDGPHRRRIHIGPFDDSFDPPHRFRLILMLDVLEHLDQPAAAAARIRDLLTEDGVCVLTVPALPWLWTGHDTVNRHVTRYTAATLRSVLEPAGLEIVLARYLFHWVACAKLAIRCKERMLGSSLQPPRVPPAPVNWLLTRLTAAELRGGRGLGLPFGSSLLAVVKRATNGKRSLDQAGEL